MLAKKIIAVSLTISEGWMPNIPKSIRRDAPSDVIPILGIKTRINRKILNRKSIREKRLIKLRLR